MAVPSWMAALPRGDGHPVMILPGFVGNDSYNRPLRLFLRAMGYHAVGWKQGRNLGHGKLDWARLGERVEKLYHHEGRKISLIGHSLGGVFAREAARRHPERIRQVVSLGSPIGKYRQLASALHGLYELLNESGHLEGEEHWHVAPEVPVSAVYTRFDGVLDWRVCLQRDGHSRCENIEVYGSHNGMTLNPMVWALLANRLATNPDAWHPFRSRGFLQLSFPNPAWGAQEPGPAISRAGQTRASDQVFA